MQIQADQMWPELRPEEPAFPRRGLLTLVRHEMLLELIQAFVLVLPKSKGRGVVWFDLSYWETWTFLEPRTKFGKAMAPHSSTLAWKIPRTEEPRRLQSMGSLESDTTERLHFHFSLFLEKEMATHSSVLAWRIPGMGEPGGLPSMGSHRAGHDWSNLAELNCLIIQGLPSLSSNQDCGKGKCLLKWWEVFYLRNFESSHKTSWRKFLWEN